MKFICKQQVLSKALNTVSKAVTTKTTIPILKGILLKADDDGKLILTSSDLDMSIEKSIDAKIEKKGSVVVLSRLFSDIIRKLPNEDILIEEKENNNILIKTSSSEFTIVGLPSDEFPAFGEVEEANSFCINKEVFTTMIKRTSFAASIDESKGVIVGILIEMENNSINMVSLDGFRMAVAREQMKNEEQKKIIISAKILNEISKILVELEDEEDIKIILNDKKALIIANETKIILRLFEGEFIKYKDIIPKEYKCRIKVERTEILNSIERASLLAKEGKNNLIKMITGANKMILTSRSEEGNVKEEVAIEREGNDLEIGFNSKYLLDVFKVISDNEIIMEFNSSVTPCLVKPVDKNDYEYLILPVRISN